MKLKRGGSGVAAVFIMGAATGAVFAGNGLNPSLCSPSTDAFTPRGFVVRYLACIFEALTVLIATASEGLSDN